MNLTINGIEEANTRAGAPYHKVNTSQGQMSCWDAILVAELQKNIGKPVEVEVEVSKDGKYQSIRQFLGTPQETEVSKPEFVTEINQIPDKDAYIRAGVATRFAVDLFIAGKITEDKIRENAKLMFKLMNDVASGK